MRLISRSLGSRYDGPGDGRGPLNDIAAHANGRGILWVNSGGNNGSGKYYRHPVRVVGDQVARVDDPRALPVQEVEVIGDFPALPGGIRNGRPEQSDDGKRRDNGDSRPHAAILEQACGAANVTYRSITILSA